MQHLFDVCEAGGPTILPEAAEPWAPPADFERLLQEASGATLRRREQVRAIAPKAAGR